MKNLILFFVFTISSSSSLFAQNLVPNGSFELKEQCPSSEDQLEVAKNWFNAAKLSPDYFHECAEFVVGVPDNFQGHQQPFDGEAYAGIYVTQNISIPNVREYLTIELSEALVKGSTYYISFQVSLGDRSFHAVNQLGAYFSSQTYSMDYDYLIQASPQVANELSVSLVDKEGWTAIQGTYTPEENGVKYLTIGNFLNDGNSIIELQSLQSQAYYYIDDVYVGTAPPSADEVNIEVNLYPNPTSSFATIAFDNPYQVEHQVEIYNQLGQLIQKFENVAGSVLEFDCRKLAAGSYRVVVSNASGMLGNGNLVVFW